MVFPIFNLLPILDPAERRLPVQSWSAVEENIGLGGAPHRTDQHQRNIIGHASVFPVY